MSVYIVRYTDFISETDITQTAAEWLNACDQWSIDQILYKSK